MFSLAGYDVAARGVQEDVCEVLEMSVAHVHS